jgi:hypothetical protein
MLNSDSEPVDGTGSTEDAAVNAAMRTGAPGAIVLAGVASAIVVALWFAFYFLVFVPRAGAP